MFAKSTSRFKRVWKIHYRNKCHTITIFPPCALKTILELIENSFGTKWPFSVCDEHGVPTILSDCLESGIYIINEAIGVSKRYVKKEISRPEQIIWRKTEELAADCDKVLELRKKDSLPMLFKKQLAKQRGVVS